MNSDKEWQAKAEERLADAEHDVENQLKALADKLPGPEVTKERAEDISVRADRHRERARRLRRAADGEEEG
jgi:hypothetical protein